jgi:hypothetical protein
VRAPHEYFGLTSTCSPLFTSVSETGGEVRKLAKGTEPWVLFTCKSLIGLGRKMAKMKGSVQAVGMSVPHAACDEKRRMLARGAGESSRGDSGFGEAVRLFGWQRVGRAEQCAASDQREHERVPPTT